MLELRTSGLGRTDRGIAGALRGPSDVGLRELGRLDRRVQEPGRRQPCREPAFPGATPSGPSVEHDSHHAPRDRGTTGRAGHLRGDDVVRLIALHRLCGDDHGTEDATQERTLQIIRMVAEPTQCAAKGVRGFRAG